VTDPDTIDRALEFVSTASAGVLGCYLTAVRESKRLAPEFKAAVCDAIAKRQRELHRARTAGR